MLSSSSPRRIARRRLLGATLALFAAWALAPVAPALAEGVLVLCVHGKSGNVRAVTDASTCRPPESARTVAAQGPAGPPGSFRVLDAEGNDVGTFMSFSDFSNELILMNDALDAMLHLSVTAGTLRTGGFHLYEDADCQGQAWASGASANLVFGPLPDADSFLLVSPEAAMRSITYQSRGIFRGSFGGPFDCENVSGRLDGLFSPIIVITSEDLGYSIPLPAPLRVERATVAP